jgi:hypothetical protein
MGKTLPLVLAIIFLALALLFARASADGGDSVRQSAPSAAIGKQVTLDLTVIAPKGATVEINPTAASWRSLEIVSIGRDNAQPRASDAVHTIRVVVAGFASGIYQFQPAVTVVNGPEVTPRLLPVTNLEVVASLAPTDPLELSALPPPQAVPGAESPLLKPAIAIAVASATLLLLLFVSITARAFLRRPPKAGRFTPIPLEPAFESPIARAEALIETDPVAAYRTLAAAVRIALAERYGFPAPALTSRELQRRMIASGVDRLEARLVSGLLEECDAVQYGGYKPAPRRRLQDLGIAREIVEAGA